MGSILLSVLMESTDDVDAKLNKSTAPHIKCVALLCHIARLTLAQLLVYTRHALFMSLLLAQKLFRIAGADEFIAPRGRVAGENLMSSSGGSSSQ